MTDIAKTGNLIEAALWFVVALALGISAIRARIELRGVFWMLAAGFVGFGISDLIEYRTGAWWRPVGLLLLKGACVAVFVLGFGRYYWIARRKKDG